MLQAFFSFPHYLIFFMGATFSNPGSGHDPTWSGPGLGDMPESCVALVLAYLDPLEICKLSGLNRVFRQAAWADSVWEPKLPQNYKILMEKHFNEVNRLPKKDIYARLCGSVRFDGGTKEVWMDKNSGKICVGVSWRGMKISRIDDRRYWTIIQTDESRLGTIAYLHQTWWLQVDGNLELNFPKGTYSLYFRLRLGKSDKKTANLDRIYGWDIKPVRFQFCTGDGQNATSQAYLGEPRKWVKYHVGDFVVENTQISTKIKFSMMQIDCTHTKGGLCLDSVLILPKEV